MEFQRSSFQQITVYFLKCYFRIHICDTYFESNVQIDLTSSDVNRPNKSYVVTVQNVFNSFQVDIFISLYFLFCP